MYNRTKKNKDMNNNIIKSLRRTLLCTVAAAAVTIGFTACADEVLSTQNTTAPANGYKVIIPANIGGGGTRAIAYNETENQYDATFEIAEKIFVYDITQGAASAKKNDRGGYELIFLNPDTNAKTANLVGELSFTKYDEEKWSYGEEIAPEVGDQLMLLYNDDFGFYYNRDYPGNNYQNYSCDYALAIVEITSIEDGVIKTSFASFENLQSIYRINFTGIEDGVKIKKIEIKSEKNQLVTYYYPFRKDWTEEFGVVNYIYEGEGIDPHESTFMLRYSENPNQYYDSNDSSTSGDVFSFTAYGSNGHYYFGQKEVADDLENGLYYQADVKMTDGGMAMKVTNTTTGEIYTPSTYCSVFTNTADYVAEYNGYGTCIEWYGDNDANHTLTIKNLTMNNSRDVAIAVKTYGDGSDNAKVHKLVLDGDNTLSVTGWNTSLTVQNNCSLIISSASTGTGKLNLKADEAPALGMWDDATVTIESGEVTLDGSLGLSDNNSCVIGANGKLRILTEKMYPNTTDCIKAASGYVLVTTEKDGYTVFTVTEAPPYENPKALSAVTTDDIGKIIGSDGNIHVLHWDLPEGVSPVGMIASVSSGHGLAIAMDWIKVQAETDWGGYEIRGRFSWDNSAYYNDGKTATEIFQNWATNNEVSFGTWRIPSKDEYQNMILSCRIDGDATMASDYNMISNGFRTKLKEAGVRVYNYYDYWTNTPKVYEDDEENGRYYMRFDINDDGSSIINFYHQYESSTAHIIPMLEFEF